MIMPAVYDSYDDDTPIYYDWSLSEPRLYCAWAHWRDCHSVRQEGYNLDEIAETVRQELAELDEQAARDE